MYKCNHHVGCPRHDMLINCNMDINMTNIHKFLISTVNKVNTRILTATHTMYIQERTRDKPR